jgi:peptide/nickel transport system ATP-binding protein/oligopeptide transport system ATP-binding protein
MGVVKAVDGISFSVNKGNILGIVGESGCGKSVTALSIMRLIPNPPGKIESGEILLGHENILHLSKSEMRKIRGKKISMIFQEPMTSLNPLFKIGDQISEAIRLHQGFSRKEAFNKSVEILQLVGIPSPEKRVHDYPHQLSGGMRQRVMIAMALSCQPKIMLADEPTTALDVTIQAQILDLIQKLREETGTAIILITHNMGVIAETVQDVIVMYAGTIMEHATVGDLLEDPHHPYTESLLKSIPRLDRIQKKRLHVIPGIVPSLLNLPEGCKFNDRCEKSFSKCLKEEPPLFEVSSGHISRCWLHEK